MADVFYTCGDLDWHGPGDDLAKMFSGVELFKFRGVVIMILCERTDGFIVMGEQPLAAKVKDVIEDLQAIDDDTDKGNPEWEAIGQLQDWERPAMLKALILKKLQRIE